MRFFRHRTDFGWLALLALTLQLVASFGHVHAAARPAAGTPLACRTFFPPSADKPCAPATRDDRACSVCLATALAGTGLAAPPPALSLPAPVAVAVACRSAETSPIRRPAAAFEARGPPAATHLA